MTKDNNGQSTGILHFTREKSWLLSFTKTDPRWKIKRYFQNQVLKFESQQNRALMFFDSDGLTGDIADKRPAAFSVWRPTSLDAIRLMMLGKGTGKGLDIKGKSAKCGKLSGFVPLVQIHNNDSHKYRVGTSPKNARIRIFFGSETLRDLASTQLHDIMSEMNKEFKNAKIGLQQSTTEEEYDEHLTKMIWEIPTPVIDKIDDYGPNSFGLDIPERLFWEAFIMRGNCTREKGSDLETGRPSSPEFFLLNLKSTRGGASDTFDVTVPRPVAYQQNEENPMDPMSLCMAYEENDSVLPVVSDFDPFLVGTRGVSYLEKMDPDQVSILKWCIQSIENILKIPDQSSSWIECWLNVLKHAADAGFHPDTPRYGYGDPTSYALIEQAVGNLQKSGAVRHGSECFNYYFPQLLDEEFLVICPSEIKGAPYRYMNQTELKKFLLEQIQKGFTFPLNMKWVLCDPGWLEIWYALRSSTHPEVQKSLDVWYPPHAGIREEIDRIAEAFPRGFTGDDKNTESTEALDLAMLRLNRHQTLRRAKKKLRLALMWLRMSVKDNKDLRSSVRLSQFIPQDGNGELKKSVEEVQEFDKRENSDEYDYVSANGNGHGHEQYSERKLSLIKSELLTKIKLLEIDEKNLKEKQEELSKELTSVQNLVKRSEAKLKFIGVQYQIKLDKVKEQEAELEKLRNLDKREIDMNLKEIHVKTKEMKLDEMISDLQSKIEMLQKGSNVRDLNLPDLSILKRREMDLRKKEMYIEMKEKSVEYREKQLMNEKADLNKKQESFDQESLRGTKGGIIGGVSFNDDIQDDTKNTSKMNVESIAIDETSVVSTTSLRSKLGKLRSALSLRKRRNKRRSSSRSAITLDSAIDPRFMNGGKSRAT